MQISGILFDLDGTLTRPHGIDFPAVKRAIGCPPDEPAWEFILAIPDDDRREHALVILDRFEMQAATASVPNATAEETLLALHAARVPMAVLTRNSRAALNRSLANFPRIRLDMFEIALTRDDGHEPKPHPEGMLKAAEALGIPPSELLCVGDYRFDVEGAHNAGALSAYITNDEDLPALKEEPHIIIHRLDELLEIDAIARLLSKQT